MRRFRHPGFSQWLQREGEKEIGLAKDGSSVAV